MILHIPQVVNGVAGVSAKVVINDVTYDALSAARVDVLDCMTRREKNIRVRRDKSRNICFGAKKFRIAKYPTFL